MQRKISVYIPVFLSLTEELEINGEFCLDKIFFPWPSLFSVAPAPSSTFLAISPANISWERDDCFDRVTFAGCSGSEDVEVRLPLVLVIFAGCSGSDEADVLRDTIRLDLRKGEAVTASSACISVEFLRGMLSVTRLLNIKREQRLSTFNNKIILYK